MDELLDPNISNQNNFQGGGQRTLPNSTAVLVLGIISIVGCIFYGVPGLVCGIIAIFLHKKDKALYESNKAAYENSFKTSKAGNVCAIVGTSLSALYLLIVILFLIFAVSMGTRFPYR